MSKKKWGFIICAVALVIFGLAVAFYLSIIRHPVKPDVLRAGFVHDFVIRKDSYPGLVKHYDLKFPFEPDLFDLVRTCQQLIEGRVDVISGHSTSACMRKGDLVVLKDDKNFFPPYEAAPLIRGETLIDHPELKDILGRLAGKISDEEIRELNYQVEEQGKAPAKMAKDFLVSKKLIDPGKGPGDGSAGTITVGAKYFTEQEILAEIMAILIDCSSNLKVSRRLNLGSTATVFSALRQGEIDLYIEYTGTGLNHFNLLNREVIWNPEKAFETVRSKFAVEYDLEWLERLGFNNTWTLVMRSKDTKELGIKTISDLARALKEQSEALAQWRKHSDYMPTKPKPKEYPLTIEEQLQSLKQQIQPPSEADRKSVAEEEVFRQAYDDLAYSKSKLKSVKMVLSSGQLSQTLKYIKESEKNTLNARIEAEKRWVNVLKQIPALDEYEAEETSRMMPDQEIHAAFRRLNKTISSMGNEREKLHRYKKTLNEYGRHLKVLKGVMKTAGASDEELKALRDETVQTLEEIKSLQRHADEVTRQLEKLKKDLLLEIKELEESEERMKEKVGAGIEPTRSITAGITIDELRREVERREEKAQQVEKQADVFEWEAKLVRELVDLKKREKKDKEWELESLWDELERLKKERASGDEIATARENIDFLHVTLVGLQKALTQLNWLVLTTDQRAEKKEDYAECVQQDAKAARARLDKEETRLRRKTISSWVIASIFTVITIMLAIVVRRLVRRREYLSLRDVTDPEKTRRVKTLYLLINRIAVPSICIVGGLLVLVQFEMFRRIGVTIFASAGILSVIIGFAARSLLANAMAGITLSFSQPIRVGDTVKIEGEYGTIEDIGLIKTTLRVWDNRRLIIPNEVLASKELVNYSLRDQRIWAKVPIQLDYSADVKKAREILIDVAKQSKNWNGQDEPVVWFMELNEQTITLWVAAWADDPSKAWGLRCDILDNALRRFQEEGIPVPRQRLQLDGPEITREPGKDFQPKDE